MKNKKLKVIIGCDCDHDRPLFNRRLKSGEISWDGFLSLRNNFDTVRSIINEQTGLVPRLIWNIRADKQVKYFHGKYEYCFEEYFKHLHDPNQNDEIAWHHHMYDEKEGVFFPNFNKEFIIEQIPEAYSFIKKYNLRTLHTGWCFNNTYSINKYNDVGIKIDYSYLPGVYMIHESGYDYSRVKNFSPFIPSRSDYQKSLKDSNSNSITEIPTSTVKNRFLSIKNILGNARRKNYNVLNACKYSFIQINANPVLFKPFVKSFFRDNKDNDYFITYFHADELLSNDLKSIPAKLLYDKSFMSKNIIYLINMAKKHNREISFETFKNYTLD